MLWALLAAAIVGAVMGARGGPDVFEAIIKDWKKGLKKHVKDKTKRAAALQIVDRFKKHVEDMYVMINGHLESLGPVHRAHGSTMEDYAPGLDALGAGLVDAQVGMFDFQVEMVDLIGKDAFANVLKGIKKDAEKREKKKAKKEAKDKKKADKKAKKAKAA